MSEWKQVIANNIPQQMNGSDCGVFTCLFAEYLSRGAMLTFSQSDIPYFRKRMVYEICKNQILNLVTDTITSPAAGSADTVSAHDSMDVQDGCGETPEQSGEVGHGVIESDEETRDQLKVSKKRKGRLLSDSEEDEDTRDQLKVSKKTKGRLLSASEVSDTEETEDMDDGSNNADDGEKDYDSEETEVVKPAKAKQKLFDKKGKLRRDFYDVEAELSDEEDGRADVSDDEDEKGLDRFEMEEGDLDEIDEDAVRAKVKNMSKAKVYI